MRQHERKGGTMMVDPFEQGAAQPMMQDAGGVHAGEQKTARLKRSALNVRVTLTRDAGGTRSHAPSCKG